MTLTLEPRETLWDDEFNRLVVGSQMDISKLYQTEQYLVPWTVNETTFTMITSNPELNHEIYINREFVTRFRPGFERVDVQLHLMKGANLVRVTNGVDSFRAQVVSTAANSLMFALGREVYLSVTQRLRGIQANIASPWTSYISGHLLQAQPYLTKARMPRIQATRMALRTLISRSGHQDGVIDFATALAYSTPHLSPLKAKDVAAEDEYPWIDTSPTTGEHFAGKEFHTWFPNICLSYWSALFRLVHNLDSEDVPEPRPMTLVDVSDSQILLRVLGGDIESHQIDALSVDCAVVDDFLTCMNMSAFVNIDSVFDISICEPSIPFDAAVEYPLGFGLWDMGNVLDGNLGESGAAASITAYASNILTVGGLTGMSDADLGQYLRISGAAASGNNGDFLITTVNSTTEVEVQNPTGSAPDANNGAIVWSVEPPIPGLGGDEAFDTVDPDDPMGTGFLGVSLSGRFDGDSCLDSLAQRARRSVQFTYPLGGISTNTPVPPDVTGQELVVDLKPTPVGLLALTGTVVTNNGSDVVTGTGTLFLGELSATDFILIGNDPTPYEVLSITNNEELILVSPVTGLDQIDVGFALVPYNAPLAEQGDTTFWASCPEFFIMHGDWIRVEEPDIDLQVESAVPVKNYDAIDSDGNIKTSSIATYTSAPCLHEVRVAIGADPAFFEPKHIGMGLEISGAGAGYDGRNSILDVYEDGGDSVALLAGRVMPAVGAGPFTVTIYEPVLDRSSTDANGRRLFEIELVQPLPRDLTDEESLDLRRVPRVIGDFLAGVTDIQIATDLYPLSGDKLYLDEVSPISIAGAIKTTSTCPASRLPIWDVTLENPLPVALSDEQSLYTIAANCCWNDGYPVTPLMILSMEPVGFLS